MIAIFRRLVPLLLVVAVAGGCAPQRSTNAMVVAETVEPNSLNPMLLEGTQSAMIGGILYSFLLSNDTKGNLVPDAATEVPTLRNGGISPDGLRITYHLQPGIRWSDGKPLTARDCVFTWHAIMNPRTNVPDRYGYDQIAAVKAVGDRTVVVTLRKPFSPIVTSFLTTNSNYPVIPEHVLSGLADLNHADVERPIIGSGPFTLVEWKHGDHFTFAANPLYFRGRPHIDRLTMRFVPAPSTIVSQLQTHEIDAALELTDPSLYGQIKAIPDDHVLLTPTEAIYTVYFNTQKGLTADRAVRQAVAAAVDTDTIMKRATQGVSDSQMALRGEFGIDAIPNPQHYDPARARALLDGDGWKIGANGVRFKDGRPLTLVITTVAANQTLQSIALQFKEQLRASGIDLTIKTFSGIMYKAPAAQGGPMFGGLFDLALAPIYSEPGPFAAQFFICVERAPVGFNISRICNPAIDDEFKDILTANDPARRSRDVRVIEGILATEMPQVPLAQVRTIAVVANRIHGIAPNPETPYVNLQNWSIDK